MSLLTDEQLERFHERLFAAKDAAEALLEQSAEGNAPIATSGGAIGRLTRMDAIQMQAMSQMNQRQLGVRLQQINAALGAFAEGRYGRCNRCKRAIPLERLEALPEAPLCMKCQEVIELR